MKCRGKSSVGPISFSRGSWHCLITFTLSARRFRKTNTPSGCNTAQLAFSCCLSLLLLSPPSSCVKEPGDVCHGSNGKRRNPTPGSAVGTAKTARTRTAPAGHDQRRRCRFLLQRAPGALRCQSGDSVARGHRLHRPLRLRENHPLALF